MGERGLPGAARGVTAAVQGSTGTYAAAAGGADLQYAVTASAVKELVENALMTKYMRSLERGFESYEELHRWSVEELEGYITRLQSEIERAQAAIAARQSVRGAAEALFKKR